jgi:hypothetical protein
MKPRVARRRGRGFPGKTSFAGRRRATAVTSVPSRIRSVADARERPTPVLATGPAASDDGVTLHRLRPVLPPREIYLLWRGTLSPLAARLRELSLEAGRELVAAGACRL